jgi:hypothetical protein
VGDRQGDDTADGIREPARYTLYARVEPVPHRLCVGGVDHPTMAFAPRRGSSPYAREDGLLPHHDTGKAGGSATLSSSWCQWVSTQNRPRAATQLGYGHDERHSDPS